MKKSNLQLVGETRGPRGRFDLQAVVLIVLVTLPWWLATTCQFIVIDDADYVTRNPRVLGGLDVHAVSWAFTTAHAGFWIPLTWLSLMLDATVFGTGPAGFHATNVLFHLANVLLVYFFFSRATGAPGRSLVAALLFAMHPLRVESVAWVTERKDVLFAFFGLWAMLAYLWYVRGGRWPAYLLLLLAYACSLMSKPALVTLPVLLVLLDFWPLGRWRSAGVGRLILEKLPLAVMALADTCATVLIKMQGHILRDSVELPMTLRVENALVSYAMYLRDQVYFGASSVFYPMPGEISAIQITGAAALLLAISAAAVYVARRWPQAARPALVGWIWFLVALLPNIGLIQAGDQSRADRFTYFPAIGLMVGLVWLYPSAWLARPVVARSRLLAAGLTLALSVYTVLQLLVWRDPMTLYLDGIAHTQRPAFLEFSAGLQLQNEGYFDKALEHYALACSYNPTYTAPLFNAGVVYLKENRVDDAIECFTHACRIDPLNQQYQDALREVQEIRARATSPAL